MDIVLFCPHYFEIMHEYYGACYEQWGCAILFFFFEKPTPKPGEGRCYSLIISAK